MGISKWRKAKFTLSCLHVPRTVESPSSPRVASSARRFSDADLLSGPLSSAVKFSDSPSSSGLPLSKHGSKSSKGTCAICLTTMKPGHGHAIFTAECSHSFHFHCITCNVKHGNRICPVCRAKWKEIPFHSPCDISRERERRNTVAFPRGNNAWMSVLRQLPPPLREPSVFDDDELVDHPTENVSLSGEAVDVTAYPELSAVSRSASHDNFTILIHVKALSNRMQNLRAPVDLVTVLDISGSMTGTKMALLKQAMGFVIQHLGPTDRLSVISFSSTARRLFPLRRMTDTGRQEALQAVHGLSSNGGTNIAEGLRKGAKVMTDRKWKNPVGSIMLLSDGQDTYNGSSTFDGSSSQSDYLLRLPSSINRNSYDACIHIPVHAFGFGVDHDAVSMHSIAENSGGTFSFIEAESVIQDAFAQCIGGLLSVVVQKLQVRFECVNPGMKLGSVKAGSYKATVMPCSKMGIIDFGDLYAEEERDFLVTVDIHPVDNSCDEMSLLKVKCKYDDPFTKESVALGEANDNQVKIQRPETTTEGDLVVSLEVDRQRNRLRAMDAIEAARAVAEQGDLSRAVSVLGQCLEALSETVSAQAGDQLCVALAAEIREMQERMANQRVYESSGRPYVLSGLSSHLWQRATARGDSTDRRSVVQTYQTQSMTDMVTHSQILSFAGSSLSTRP